MKKILFISGRSTVAPPPIVNLLEFDVNNTTPSAGALTNVIGDDWSVARNSVATYINDSGVITEVAINVPRIESSKMLIELQSTNIAFFSEELNISPWASAQVVITENQDTSPDGNITSDLIMANDINHNLHQRLVTVPYTNYIFTFYAKNIDRTILQYSVHDFSNSADIIGKINYISQINNTTYTKIQVLFTTPTGAISVAVYPTRNGGIGDFYVWGVQVETGSIQSSYIKTLSSSATRQADVITITVPVGATKAETWIDGVSDGSQAVTAGDTFTMVNGTTKIIMT